MPLPILLGAAAGIGLVVALSRKASASESVDNSADAGVAGGTKLIGPDETPAPGESSVVTDGAGAIVGIATGTENGAIVTQSATSGRFVEDPGLLGIEMESPEPEPLASPTLSITKPRVGVTASVESDRFAAACCSGNRAAGVYT